MAGCLMALQWTLTAVTGFAATTPALFYRYTPTVNSTACSLSW